MPYWKPKDKIAFRPSGTRFHTPTSYHAIWSQLLEIADLQYPISDLTAVMPEVDMTFAGHKSLAKIKTN